MHKQTIKQILMSRDGMSADEADQAIADAKKELTERLMSGSPPFDICEELFDLEPDYIEELL